MVPSAKLRSALIVTAAAGTLSRRKRSLQPSAATHMLRALEQDAVVANRRQLREEKEKKAFDDDDGADTVLLLFDQAVGARLF